MKPIREGVLVGVVGAAALALWFLVVDLLAGQPFHTPAALGAGLFRGARAAESAALPEGATTLVLGYTAFHLAVFIVAGILLTHVVAMVEREPAILLVALFTVFVFFEFCYFVFTVVFVQRVLEHLSWGSLLAGNAVAAVTMGGVLWRQHPALRVKLEPNLEG